jgi:hypothetical protein
MPDEVTHRVEQGCQDRGFEALNAARLQQPPLRIIRDRPNGIVHGRTKPADQFRLRPSVTIGELGRTISPVLGVSGAVHDPLPEVPAQVQKDVLNAVVRLVRPPPEIGFGKLLETMFDFRQRIDERLSALGEPGRLDR